MSERGVFETKVSLFNICTSSNLWSPPNYRLLTKKGIERNCGNHSGFIWASCPKRLTAIVRNVGNQCGFFFNIVISSSFALSGISASWREWPTGIDIRWFRVNDDETQDHHFSDNDSKDWMYWKMLHQSNLGTTKNQWNQWNVAS